MDSPEVACGINVYCTGPEDPNLDHALEDMARLGYTHVAFGPIDGATTPAAGLAQRLANAGVKPIAMGTQAPGANVSSPDAAQRRAGLDLLKSCIDYAHDLGADQMNGVNYALFKDASAPFSEDRFTESAVLLGQAADYARDAGVKLAFEVVNRYESSFLNTAEQALAYVTASGSSNLWIHLDSYHMAIEESDMLESVRSAAPRMAYLELGQSARGSILTGAVDNAAVVRAARSVGYQGRYGLEAFTRSILGAGGDGLSIWRTTFTDSSTIAKEAIDLIRAVHAESPLEGEAHE